MIALDYEDGEVAALKSGGSLIKRTGSRGTLTYKSGSLSSGRLESINCARVLFSGSSPTLTVWGDGIQVGVYVVADEEPFWLDEYEPCFNWQFKIEGEEVYSVILADNKDELYG